MIHSRKNTASKTYVYIEHIDKMNNVVMEMFIKNFKTLKIQEENSVSVEDLLVMIRNAKLRMD